MDVNVENVIEAIVLLLMGLGIVALCKRHLESNNAPIMLGGLFAPFLIYFAMSGHLVELGGAGFVAKFEREAKKQIHISETLKSVRPVATSADDIRNKADALAMFGAGAEVVIISAPGKKANVNWSDVYSVGLKIYPGLLQGNFELLVVLDDTNRMLGYFPRQWFYDLLRIELTLSGQFDDNEIVQHWERVEKQLKQTLLWDIVAYPTMRANDWGLKKTVRLSDSRRAALSVMVSSNLPAVVVVDDEGKYAGILRRGDVVSKFILSLAEED